MLFFWKKKKKKSEASSNSVIMAQIRKLDEKTRYLKMLQYGKLKEKNDPALLNKFFSMIEQQYYEKMLKNHLMKREYQSLKEINQLIDRSQGAVQKRQDLNDNIKIMSVYAKKKPKAIAELLHAIMIYPGKK